MRALRDVPALVGGGHQTFFSAAVASCCLDLLAGRRQPRAVANEPNGGRQLNHSNRIQVVPPHSPARASDRGGRLDHVVQRRRRIGASKPRQRHIGSRELGETLMGAQAAHSRAKKHGTPVVLEQNSRREQNGELSNVFLVTVRGRCCVWVKNLFKHVAISQKSTSTQPACAIVRRRAC